MQQNYRHSYRDIPKNKVGSRLNLLSRLLSSRNYKFVLNELTEISQQFIPTYKRKVSDDPLSEEELIEIEELLDEYEENEIDEIIDDTFEEIYFDTNLLKSKAMEILLSYAEEPPSNFGNRILQLADLIAISKKLDFGKKGNDKFLRFIKHELLSISKITGDDY